MSRKEEEILDAALSLFMRYGIGRTTMADISQAAGVARQTLYNAYPGKEEVLRAVVQRSAAECFAAVAAAWAATTDLGEKIDAYYTHVPLAWFDAVMAAPDAAEIIDGLNTVAKEEMASATAQWRQLFTTLFTDAGSAEPKQIADFFVSASKNAKHDVPDRETLEARLKILKRATLALI